MADKKISDLPSGSTLTGTESLEIVQSGASAKTTAQAIGDFSSKIDPWSGVNYTAAQQAFIVMGDSRNNIAQGSGPSYGQVAMALPFLTNHATYYNFGVNGQVIPSGYTGGGTTTPTTQAGTWTANSNTLTLSAPNANIAVGQLVSGSEITFGSTVVSNSGTTVILNPRGDGGIYAFTASGSGTFAFSNNSMIDVYNTYVHPLRPAVSGYAKVILTAQIGVNDIDNNFTAAQVVTNLSAFTALCAADGIVFLPQTVIMGSPLGVNNQQRQLIMNDANNSLRLGGCGIDGSKVMDVSNAFSCNANVTGSALTTDGLHPTPFAHQLWGSLLDTFLQSHGQSMSTTYHPELQTFESGINVSSSGNAFLGNNLLIGFGSLTTDGDDLFGTTPTAGFGCATISRNSELITVWTPSAGTAGQVFAYNSNNSGPLVRIKQTHSGIFAIGSSIDASTAGSTSGSTIVLDGSKGTITSSALGAPGIPVITPQTPGSTTWSYAVAAVAADGVTVGPLSPVGTITTGSSNLGSGYNFFQWNQVPGAASYNIYRVASGGTPSSIGLIGNTLTSGISVSATRAFIDGGSAGDGTVPTGSTAGQGDLSSGGNVIVSTLGKGIQIKEGTNAKMGSGTLVAGTLTVANTSVTANSRIKPTRTTPNSSTAIGSLAVAKTAGTGFTVTSLTALNTTATGDISSFDWIIFEPAP